jgi:hypothetical protein
MTPARGEGTVRLIFGTILQFYAAVRHDGGIFMLFWLAKPFSVDDPA